MPTMLKMPALAFGVVSMVVACGGEIENSSEIDKSDPATSPSGKPSVFAHTEAPVASTPAGGVEDERRRRLPLRLPSTYGTTMPSG